MSDSVEDEPFMSVESQQLGTTSSITLRQDSGDHRSRSSRAPWLRVIVIEHGRELDASVGSARRAYSTEIGPNYEETTVNDHEALLVSAPETRSMTLMWSESEDTAIRVHGYEVPDDLVIGVAEGLRR